MAYDLSGGTAIIEADAITLPAKMTLSIWSRRTGNGGAGFGRLVEHCSADQSTVGSMRLMNNGATAVNTYAFVYPWTTLSNWTFSRPPTDTWAHIMIAYDSSATANIPTVWVDGSAVAVTTVSAPAGSPRAQTDSVAFGNRVFAKDRQFSGAVAEIAYWETLQGTAVAQRLASGERAYDVAPTALRLYSPLAGDTRNWITDVSATTAGADITTGGAPILVPVAGSSGLLQLSGNAANTLNDWRTLPETGVLRLDGQAVDSGRVIVKAASVGLLTLAGGAVRSGPPDIASAPTAGALSLLGGAVVTFLKRIKETSGGLLTLAGGAAVESHYDPQTTYHGKWRAVGGAVDSVGVLRQLQRTEAPRVQSWMVRLRGSTAKAKVSDPRTKFVKVARIYANPLRTMTPSVGLLQWLGGAVNAGKVFLAATSSGKLTFIGGVPTAIIKSKLVAQGIWSLLGGAVDQRGQPVTRQNGTVRAQSWLVRLGGSAAMARVSDARTKFVKVARIHTPLIIRSSAPSAGALSLVGGETEHRRELYVGEPTSGRLVLLGGDPVFAIGNVRRAVASTGIWSLFGGAPAHTNSYGWAYLADASASWSDMPSHGELIHVLS